MSPITAVLEHLNERATGSVRSEDSESVSADTGRPISAKADEQNPKANKPDRVLIPDFTGRWSASLLAVGGETDIPRWFNFRQDRARLTGTGGPDSSKQFPITGGLVAGDSIKFKLDDGRRTFLYDLKIEGNGLRGTVSIRSADEMRTAEVWLERAR
jgi:hypothetical protein